MMIILEDDRLHAGLFGRSTSYAASTTAWVSLGVLLALQHILSARSRAHSTADSVRSSKHRSKCFVSAEVFLISHSSLSSACLVASYFVVGGLLPHDDDYRNVTIRSVTVSKARRSFRKFLERRLFVRVDVLPLRVPSFTETRNMSLP